MAITIVAIDVFEYLLKLLSNKFEKVFLHKHFLKQNSYLCSGTLLVKS